MMPKLFLLVSLSLLASVIACGDPEVPAAPTPTFTPTPTPTVPPTPVPSTPTPVPTPTPTATPAPTLLTLEAAPTPTLAPVPTLASTPVLTPINCLSFLEVSEVEDVSGKHGLTAKITNAGQYKGRTVCDVLFEASDGSEALLLVVYQATSLAAAEQEYGELRSLFQGWPEFKQDVLGHDSFSVMEDMYALGYLTPMVAVREGTISIWLQDNRSPGDEPLIASIEGLVELAGLVQSRLR